MIVYTLRDLAATIWMNCESLESKKLRKSWTGQLCPKMIVLHSFFWYGSQKSQNWPRNLWGKSVVSCSATVCMWTIRCGALDIPTDSAPSHQANGTQEWLKKKRSTLHRPIDFTGQFFRFKSAGFLHLGYIGGQGMCWKTPKFGVAETFIEAGMGEIGPKRHPGIVLLVQSCCGLRRLYPRRQRRLINSKLVIIVIL